MFQNYQIPNRFKYKDIKFISAMYQYIKRFENKDSIFVNQKLMCMLAYDQIYDIDHHGQTIRDKIHEFNIDSIFKIVEKWVDTNDLLEKAKIEYLAPDE